MPSHYLNQWWLIIKWTLWKNFSEIWIKIRLFSIEKMHLKMLCAKWQPFCLGLNVSKLLFAYVSSSELSWAPCWAVSSSRCRPSWRPSEPSTARRSSNTTNKSRSSGGRWVALVDIAEITTVSDILWCFQHHKKTLQDEGWCNVSVLTLVLN